ncbi:hypothetical protein Tco_0228415, partial [Tanacetum coccineum]
TMTDVDVNAPAELAPTMPPPTHTDDQILPHIRWHTNFFRAFPASSAIPAIYIQQFWDTIRYDKIAGGYKCQLDEQWFDLSKDTLRDTLQITPIDRNNAFSSPSTPDALIKFVNDLGYPKVVRHLSNVVTNDMFQPWRALTTIINLCLTGKTSGFERPRALVLQILWGVINRAHIDYEERTWEEFTQSIHTFIEVKKNLAQHTHGKKKATLIVIPSIRFTKLIIHYLQSKHKFHTRLGSPLHLPNEEPVLGYLKFSSKGTKREVFGMPISNDLITDDIRGKQYYNAYLEKVAKHQRYLAGEDTTKSTPSQPPIPKHAPAKPQEKKRKQALDVAEAPSQAKRSKAEPKVDDEEAIMQKVLEESIKDAYPAHRGPLPPVVFREPDFGKLQPLPEVYGKGKEKRRTPATAEPSGLVQSSSLYAELGLTASRTESDEEVSPEMNAQGQEEGQGGTNPGDDGVSHTPLIYCHRLEEPASFAGTLSSMKKLDKNLSFTYQFLVEKSQEDEPEKTNTKAEVQSMVTVPIHQDTSFVLLMTTPVIDITDPQSDSTTVLTSMPTTTSTITETITTTTIPPPPPQLQQDVLTSILTQTIGLLEWNIADLVKENQALEKRLDKQGNRIHQLETQDLSRLIREQTVEFIDSQEIDRKIKESVKEVVTASVEHAMRAPLRARFKDLPTSDMKEILLQRMLEENYDKGHEDHKMAYEALQKSIIHDENPPPPPPPSSTTNRGDQSQGSAAPGLSKTSALIEYTAWITTTSKLKPTASSVPEDVLMHEETDFEAQDMGSNDEDSDSRHIPKMEECHKLLTNQVDEGLLRYNVSRPLPLGGPPSQVMIQTKFFFNKDLEYLRFGHKGDKLALSITKMKAASYPDAGLEQMVPNQMWAEEEYMYDISASYGISHWWFKRQQFYTDRRAIVKTYMRILSVVIIEVFSLYGSPEPPAAQRHEDYLYCRQLMDSNVGIRKWFKLPARIGELPAQPNLTKTQTDWDVDDYAFNEIHKFSDGTLQ